MDKNKGGGNSLLSAVMGAALGAGAVLLADKKTRDSLKKKLNEWVEDVENVKEDSNKRITGEIKKAKGKLDKAVDKIDSK